MKKQSRNILLQILITTLVLCLTTDVYSQIPRIYTIQRGLTTSEINDISVDKRGIVWISGPRCLETFDGNDFHPVSFYDEEKGEYISSSFNSVDDIGNNNYLVHTNKGLYVYHLNDGWFQRIICDDNENPDLGYPSAYSMPYVKPNQRVIITSGWGLFIFDSEKLEIDRKESERLHNILRESYFHHAYLDSHKNLWLNYHDYEVKLFSTEKSKFIKYKITTEAKNILASSSIESITEIDGNIYIGISNHILKYDYRTNIISVIVSDIGSPINVLCPTNDGKILVGTDSKGLFVMSKDGQTSPYLTMNASLNLDYAKVKSIEILDDGTLVIGVYQKGLIVIPPAMKDFTYHAISPDNDGINASCISAMTKGWIATDGCGMFKTSGIENQSSRVTEGLNSTLVQTVITDKHGTVWVGSYGGGVQQYADGKFITPDWLSSFKNTPVMSLAYDPVNDVIYIGTNGMGVMVANIKAQKCMNLASSDITNTWISTLHYDSQESTLWIGTPEDLFFVNTKNKKGGKMGYKGIQWTEINSIKTDIAHVFVGTSMGLVIADKNDPIHDEPLHMLRDERVMALEMSKSDLWVATSGSIVRIDDIVAEGTKKNAQSNSSSGNGNEPKFTIYKSFGGVFIGEFHRNSSMKTSKGRILFGADNGIISFLPEKIRQNQKLNKDLIFTSITIGDRKPTISVPDYIELEANENAINVTFCVPNLALPQRIQYEYMVEGIDNTWRTCQGSAQAHYSGLRAGKYTLKVRAYDETDKENYIETSLKIKVAPHWYASIWAWIAYLLIIGILTYNLVRAYKLRQRQQLVIRQVRQEERLKEARLKLFTSIAHELRSPLTMIVSPLKQIMSTDNDKSRQYHYNIMMRNSQRLLNIVKQITDIRQIDSGKLHLMFREVNFINYANNIYDNYAAYAAMKKISFIVEHSVENLHVWIDPVHFEKIISNLLSNAFKFTPEDGTIIVRTNVVGNKMELRFYNTGFNGEGTELEQLFERFYQGSNSDGQNGSGIGLSLVDELTRMHHGDISVHKVEPDGIEFLLHFPIGNEHLAASEMVIEKEEEETPQLVKNEDLKIELTEITLPPTDGKPDPNKRYTLLVVDDDKDLCQYVADQLAEQYNVITANSGNSAWQQVLSVRPDVVVTDIRMPDGDGLELCQRIKSNPETDNIPTIILTSENDDEVHLKSLALKADHFISKPFNLLMLQGAISQVLYVREIILQRTVRKDVASGDYTRVTLTSADSKLFERIQKSIQDHLDDSEYGVEEMASEVGISRVHLNRKMKEHYGVSPNTFIKTYRLKQAAYLLVHTSSVNISEVAYTVGFSTAAYFSTSFRAHFGMTPKEFVAHYSDNLADETLQKLLV